MGYERGVFTRRPETVSDYLESMVYDQEVPQHVRDYLNRLLDRVGLPPWVSVPVASGSAEVAAAGGTENRLFRFPWSMWLRVIQSF